MAETVTELAEENAKLAEKMQAIEKQIEKMIEQEPRKQKRLG